MDTSRRLAALWSTGVAVALSALFMGASSWALMVEVLVAPAAIAVPLAIASVREPTSLPMRYVVGLVLWGTVVGVLIGVASLLLGSIDLQQGSAAIGVLALQVLALKVACAGIAFIATRALASHWAKGELSAL
jgi:hypothetical protein